MNLSKSRSNQRLDPDLPRNEKQRRVALAGWIASASNPLTARVMVNRLWQFVFGTGLVATASDFGPVAKKLSLRNA